MNQKNKTSLVSYGPLIKKWEEFLAEGESSSVEDFARWILKVDEGSSRETVLNDAQLQMHFDQTNQLHQFYYLSPEASYLLWKLNKFMRIYTKALFQKVGLSSHDEFAILAHIDYKKGCTKKEAIDENLIGLTTGVDIVNRLINKGLVEERVNPEDRREKLLKLTVDGGMTLQKVYQGFAETQDLLADLDKTERERLVTSLRRLEEFHTLQNEIQSQ